MRYTKETSKAIRQWLKNYGFDSTCRLGKEFECDPSEHIIYIPRNNNGYGDYDFIICLRKLGLQNDFDTSTLSVLHELGHAETENNFSDFEWDMCALLKMELYEKSDKMDFSKYIQKYWNIKDEKMANKWLVKFVNNNPFAVQELEDILATNW